MRRVFYSCLYCFGLPLSLWAQSINYSILINDPNQARNISLASLYAGFDFGNKSITYRRSTFYTGPHFSAEANYSVDIIKKDTSQKMAGSNPYHEFDVVLSVHISDRIKAVPQKVTVSHSTDGLYNYESYFNVNIYA